MAHITDGTIHVFTYKEGLLSKVAHDLRLRLRRFEIDHSGSEITARFWPATLEVEGAMRDGSLDPGALKPKDKQDISKNIQTKILHTGRHPEARLEARLDGVQVEGTFTLAGRGAPIAFTATTTDGRIRGRLTLVPSRHGIKPFKALMGAIKLQDKVDVVFDLPADGD